MLEVIVYDSIEKKTPIEQEAFKSLTCRESLTQSLNMIDFLIALNPNQKREEDAINWIVLNLAENDK